MEEPYIPFYKPLGMSDEQYAQEIDEARERHAEWEREQHQMEKEMMRETIKSVQHAIKESKLDSGAVLLGDKLESKIISFK